MPAFNTAGLIRYGVALGMLCGIAASALGAGDSSQQRSGESQPANTPGPSETLFDFNIPAQALAVALNKYASLTERAALFRSEMVAGRISAAVQGRYTPEAALAVMVQGTGLVLEKIPGDSGDAFVLKPAAPTSSSMQAALNSSGTYPALLQNRLWEALCRSARTAPGRYHALLSFQVDDMGRLRQAELLGSTGDAGRDAAMLDALGHVQMDSSPPPAMPQPLIMAILPNEPGRADGGRHCDDRSAGKTGVSRP